MNFPHNSPRRHHLAQARMVSSSKYTLWTVFAQTGNYSPRRESSSLKRGYSRPSEGTVAQARKSLEQVCSLECFRLGEKSFTQARRYSHPGESIFAQAKIDLALWTTFAQAIKFSLRRGIFSPERNWSRPSLKKKKTFFFAFCF